jgi:2-methylisocitrate lyase-like PEP mutase family enzyme
MRLRNDVIKTKPSTEFRRLLTEGPHPAMGVWGGTAQHAQLAEATGFSYFGISGSHTASHIHGLPDAGFITLTEIVDNTRRICQAVSIPVIVDCDTGFGNAINVVRTVDEVIRAGAAGLFIEDQVAPKRCGFVKGKELVSVEEAVSKFRAACDTRDGLDKDVIIQARTDARGAVGGGMDEVMRRCEAYLKAGVDSIYVEALQSVEEIYEVRKAFPDAMLKITPYGLDPAITEEQIKELRLCMMGFQVHRVGAIAMYDFLVKYREGGEAVSSKWAKDNKNHPLGGFGLFDLTGFPQVMDLEKKYLSEESLARYDQSLGVYDPRVGHGKLAKQ